MLSVVSHGRMFELLRSAGAGMHALVKVLRIEPSELNPGKLVAYIEHIEDHPYGYKKGDKGWYNVEDLVYEGTPGSYKAARGVLADLPEPADSDEKLRQFQEALKPFARLYHPMYAEQNDNQIFYANDAGFVTYGDLRRALKLLTEQS